MKNFYAPVGLLLASYAHGYWSAVESGQGLSVFAFIVCILSGSVGGGLLLKVLGD